jgi:hypothetical protein
VLSSVYGSKIVDALSGKVPDQALEVAQSGVGGALAVAEKAGGAGTQIADVARNAFVDAMHSGAIVAAVAAFIGVIVAVVFLPAHARPADEALQEQEFSEEMAEAAAHGEGVEVVSQP